MGVCLIPSHPTPSTPLPLLWHAVIMGSLIQQDNCSLELSVWSCKAFTGPDTSSCLLCHENSRHTGTCWEDVLELQDSKPLQRFRIKMYESCMQECIKPCSDQGGGYPTKGEMPVPGETHRRDIPRLFLRSQHISPDRSSEVPLKYWLVPPPGSTCSVDFWLSRSTAHIEALAGFSVVRSLRGYCLSFSLMSPGLSSQCQLYTVRETHVASETPWVHYRRSTSSDPTA